MKWLINKQFIFVIGPSISIFGAGCLLFCAHASWTAASASFAQASSALTRLEQALPFPNEENVGKMKSMAKDYEKAAANLRDKLHGFVRPAVELAPSDFQTQLRLAVTRVTEAARQKAVVIPAKFHFGLDEFASALPPESDTPFLGQELAESEWILSTLLDSGVESVPSYRRSRVIGEPTAPRNGSEAKERGVSSVLRRTWIEVTFVSTEEAARRALNQITGDNSQFVVVRLLRIKSQQQKGPGRDAVVSPEPVRQRHSVRFIVGDERVETTATIELVRLAL